MRFVNTYLGWALYQTGPVTKKGIGAMATEGEPYPKYYFKNISDARKWISNKYKISSIKHTLNPGTHYVSIESDRHSRMQENLKKLKKENKGLVIKISII